MGSYYLTGHGVEPAGAPLSVAWGLIQGFGLFETMRTKGTRILQLSEHLNRLYESAPQLSLPLPDRAALSSAAQHVLDRESLPSGGRFRIIAARAGESGAEIIFTLEPFEGYSPELYERGMRARLNAYPRNERSPLSRLKTISFIENLLAREQAQGLGFDEGIFLNTRAQLAEGTSSNLFWFSQSVLCTPSLECGCLPGVTRSWTIASARRLGIEVQEGAYPAAAFEGAEEGFLTSSLRGIMPLTELDGVPIGGGRPGADTARLRLLYQDEVT